MNLNELKRFKIKGLLNHNIESIKEFLPKVDFYHQEQQENLTYDVFVTLDPDELLQVQNMGFNIELLGMA